MADYPCWGAFTMKWNNKSIRVPAGLNSVARYKPGSFWDWLTTVYADYSYLELTMEHLKQEELKASLKSRGSIQ